MAAFAVFHQNDGQRLVAVNADQVISLAPNGSATQINLAGERYSMVVDESFEQVVDELGSLNSPAYLADVASYLREIRNALDARANQGELMTNHMVALIETLDHRLQEMNG